MNDPKTNDLEELISRALRGKLSEEERRRFEDRLNEDAALRERFEEDKALEQLLARAPRLEASSNFTSLVLQAARKETREVRWRGPSWLRFTFARVAAGLTVVLAAGFFAIQQYRQAEREQMARSLDAFAEVTAVIHSEATPSAAVLQDFEVIQRLPQEAELDLELLVALQR
jgi:anti-sigma factor RsiW